jgi:hypothetical protein
MLFGALGYALIRAYPKIPKWHRKNPGECFNAGFFRCLGYNFGICSKPVGPLTIRKFLISPFVSILGYPTNFKTPLVRLVDANVIILLLFIRDLK